RAGVPDQFLNMGEAPYDVVVVMLSSDAPVGPPLPQFPSLRENGRATGPNARGQLRGMTMKNRTIVGLLLVCCAWIAAASAAQLAPTTCDRECLRGQMTQLLYALLKHDVGS